MNTDARAQPRTAAEQLSRVDEAHARGDIDSAMRHATEGLAQARADGDRALQADALLRMVVLHLDVDDFESGMKVLTEARPLIESDPDPGKRFRLDNLLAQTLGAAKDFETSIAMHERGLQLARQHLMQRAEGVALINLGARRVDYGEHLHAEGRPAEAEAQWECTLALLQPLVAQPFLAEHPQLMAAAYGNLGCALQFLGRGEAALAAVDAADHWAGAHGLRVRLDTTLTRALVHQRLGQLDCARQLAKAALDGVSDQQYAAARARLHLFLCDLEVQAGNAVAALQHHRDFHALSVAAVSRAALASSRMLAVQLQTERALAEAAAERANSSRLARENHSLSEQALQDALTGLPNRRRLDRHLASSFDQARAQGQPLCGALLDLDRFKAINDRHSHAVGDQVLRRVAQLMLAQIRTQDLAARLGGEEFIVVFSNISLQSAQSVCERLRAAVEQHDWSAVAAGLQVTASLGLADIATHADPGLGLEQVDALMYRAKREGRNRVLSA